MAVTGRPAQPKPGLSQVCQQAQVVIPQAQEGKLPLMEFHKTRNQRWSLGIMVSSWFIEADLFYWTLCLSRKLEW